jgi:hypothetical protein
MPPNIPLNASERIAQLEQLQRATPADLVVAHDLGLAYYWKARAQGTAGHWRRVIANWAPVLDNDSYWDEWCKARSAIYAHPITQTQATAVREALRKRLVTELAAATLGTSADPPLETIYYLERLALAALKRARALAISDDDASAPTFGPLLAEQLDLAVPLDRLFRADGAIDRASRDPLSPLLEGVRSVAPDEEPSPPAIERHVRICFSQLGPVLACVKRGDGLRALGVIAAVRCPECSARADGPEAEWPAPCRTGCLLWARANPGYRGTPDGSELFRRNAVELRTAALLSAARQKLDAHPADVASTVAHLSAALGAAAKIGMADRLAQELEPTLRGWAQGLAQNQRQPDAIALLDGVKDLACGAACRIELARILNASGVEHANAGRFGPAVDDLRRVHELHPHNPVYRQNLARVLMRSAKDTHEAGDTALAADRLREAIAVAEADATASPDSTEWAQEARAMRRLLQEYSGVAVDPFAALDEVLRPRAEPDRRPDLQHKDESPSQTAHRLGVWDRCGEGAKRVIDLAREAAIERSSPLVDLPALWSALWRAKPDLLERLLARQGLASLQVLPKLEELRYEGHRLRLAKVKNLTEDDLALSVTQALERAWDIAQYEEGIIDERHLLAALLVNETSAGWLRRAGVDIARMVGEIASQE